MSDRVRIGTSIVLATAAAAAVAFALVPQRVPGPPAQPIWPSTTATTSAPALPGEAPAAWTRQIEAAVVATAWPKLNPSLDELAGSRAAEWNACAKVSADKEATCRFGKGKDPKKTVAILGDSAAISWIPAARAGFESKGWTVQGLTFDDCPAARIDVVSTGRDMGFTESCRAHQQFALARAKALKPAIVIISTTNETLTRIVGAQGAEASAAFQQAETAAIKSLASKDTKVIVVAPPPNRQNIKACATPLSSPPDCLSDVTTSWNTLKTLEQDAAKQGGAVYLDTQPWTCTVDGQCPAFIGTTPVTTDGVHLTNTMSRRLGTLLFEAATARI
ncbi:MAG: SGNH hydrolase domain-containing protein [Micropruina sp.]|uniref:SGNH hydrolase domain-containing protein n=1 Tax=Micropruina sp. TaxID=2737536 RepID=UPI0039E2FC3B